MSPISRERASSSRPAAASPRAPPTTGVLDLVRLLGGVIGAAVRHPRDFSLRAAFRTWARRAAARRAAENLILNLGVKRVLLVGGPRLSHDILEASPKSDGLCTGAVKRRAMAFLASRALTVSDDADWKRRRAFNEQILEPGRRHELERDFLLHVIAAFDAPVDGSAAVRAAMGRAMLGIVFGDTAPRWLADDVQVLFGFVQNPLKRALLSPWAKRRRARFYDALRRMWRDPTGAGARSLLGRARRSGTELDETEVLEQIPHWMFTFTGSATDLLVRTLVLILADLEARRRAQRELDAAGPLDEPTTIEGLAYLEACLLEAAHLYPPVTRTFHRAPVGITVGDVVIPAGMEVMHSFPLIVDGEDEAPRRFRPERWLAPGGAASTFDPFLGGARRCPGRDLILFVCTSALAVLLTRQRLALQGAPLRTDALPPEFPRRGLKFRTSEGRS